MSKKRGLIQILNASAMNTNGQSTQFDFVEAFNELEIFLRITGTWSGASIAAIFQLSPNAGTNWFNHPNGSFAAFTADAAQVLVLPANAGQLARLQWTITGGPPTVTANAWLQGKKNDG